MQLRQFFEDYATHTDWKLLPIYIGLAGLTAWLGIVSVIMLSEMGVEVSELNRLSTLASGLALFFGVWPFARPLLQMAGESWLGEWWTSEL